MRVILKWKMDRNKFYDIKNQDIYFPTLHVHISG